MNNYDECLNAPHLNAVQKGKVNEQHQNAIEPIVQKDPTTLSTTHQETPGTTTQPRVVNV
jgi:hypothetical protein